MRRAVHPIEVESYRILRSRIDLSHLPPLSRAVAERVIHAAADVSFGASLVLDEAALAPGPRGAARQVRRSTATRGWSAAGITTRERDPCRRAPPGEGMTRSAAAMRAGGRERRRRARCGSSATRRPRSPSWSRARRAEPALIVGLPVGFVGAAEAKAALAASGCRA